ncbi:MAG TPA: hypothetical protein VE569_04590, partial [Acidimicrobiia bacterium]|nr:hypothetical protein [Acidimicrobiia bacterium]
MPTVVDEDLVSLEFDFACGYWDTGTSCVPEGLLHVGYGNEFSEVPLSEVDRDSLRVLVAEVPATDNAGGSLEYYLDVTDSVGGVSVRYPTTGAISPFVAHNPVDVSLGTAEHVPGDRILFFPWGADADSVGIDKGSEQATLGPQAIDVTPTGDALAILDGVNRRVVITDLATKDMVSVSVD